MGKNVENEVKVDDQITMSREDLMRLVADMVAQEIKKEEIDLYSDSVETAAETAEQQAKRLHMEELVPIKLFKDRGNYKDDVIVAVNGKCWQIQRGIEVKVPRYVAAVLENSQAQDAYSADYIDTLTAKYQADTAAQG